MLKPIVKKTLHKEVMQALTEAINGGTWQVGEKLPGEIALAEAFQVSRACIREVLKALSYSGILESRAGRGTFLRAVPNQSPAIDALGSLLVEPYTSFIEMRQVLHGQAAYWACERATPEELANLERIIFTEGQELSNAHRRFHEEVLQLSHNPILTGMVAQLEESFKGLRDLNFIILPDQDRVEHIQVFEAIKNGPPARARQVMMKHVVYIWRKPGNPNPN
ncbi:MAG: FadR family transcriptional regulator [Deltaproteobacteria bacterium]|jgi:GntR family transcriptional repressor for pyruvate dehydrogenase complex|nr:FadR family transcriptional regulator [Deltaproteobacteria bacterium]